MQNKSPYDWLKSFAETQPQKTFFYSEDDNHEQKPISFRSFLLRVNNFSRDIAEYPPQTIIAVCSDNPLDYLVCMIASIKMQTIYVPFDNNFNNTAPETISEQLELAMKHQKRLGFIYTSNRNFLPRALKKYEKIITYNDTDSFEVAQREFVPSRPAYICCSSGTTDRPKLILGSYESLLARVVEHAEQVLSDRANQVLLGFSGFDFDASLMDTFMVLFKGQSLLHVSNRVKHNIFYELPNLFKLAAKQGYPITAAVLVPKILRGIDDDGLNPRDFPGLQTIVAMGDSCKMEWLRPWLQQGTKIYHGYGHTETSIASLVSEITSSDTYLPLGKPLDGVIIYLVEPTEKDKDFNVVATIDKNTPQQKLLEYCDKLQDRQLELFQGGNGVGSYIHQDELVFFEDSGNRNWPFTGSKRVYRSDDLVSLCAGNLIFKDRHRFIKRNGVRIYLSNIKTRYNDSANIKFLHVDKLHDFIAIYLKFNEGISEDVRQKTIDILYQIRETSEPKLRPDFFIEIDKLSATSRFKVTVNLEKTNFKLLHKTGSSPCQTQLEQKLAQLYAQLLLPPNIAAANLIQRDTNFTSLGGDSIQISRLTSRIWREIMQQDPRQGIPFDFSNFIFRNLKLCDIALFVETYQYDASKVYKLKSSAFPIFYLSNLTAPETALLQEDILPSVVRLVPKQFDCQEYDTSSVSKSWESMLEQCVRAIYKSQQVGPYLLLANKSDLLFAKQVANMIAGTLTVYLLCYNNNTLAIEKVSQSLQDWSVNRKSDFVTKIEIVNIEDSTQLKNIINQHYHHINEQQLQSKINKYFQTLDEQYNSTLTTEPPNNAVNVDKLHGFCSQDSIQTLFLSGPTNSGKKAICWKLFKQLQQQYLSKQSQILPLIIDVCNSDKRNPLKVLTQHGFTTDDCNLLRQKKIIVIIFNFDKTKRYDFPNYHHELQHPKHFKLIICTRDYITSSLIAYEWPKSSYQRLEISSASFNRQNYNSEFLAHWLRQELRHQSLSVKKKLLENVDTFFEFILNLPVAIFIKPIFSLWDPRSTSEDRPYQEVFNHPYFPLIKGLLKKESVDDLYTCPDWLREIARENLKLESKRVRFSEFEIDLHRIDSTLTTLLKPEELQDVIAQNQSLVPLNTTKQQTPLFFFHPLTGNTPSEYRTFAKMLGPTQPVFSFVMSNNATSSIDFHERCCYYAALINKIQPQGAVHLVGWSFGGLLVAGVASVLEKTRKLGLLLNIDCPSPPAIQGIAAGARAVDLIMSLPKIINVPFEFNIKDNCKDLNNLNNTQLTTAKLNNILDTVFNQAIEFYTKDSKLPLHKKKLMTQVLQNSCLNLKAGYSSSQFPLNINKSTLHIIEAGFTPGINEPDKLAGTYWEKCIPLNAQKVYQYHNNDHFNVCENREVMALFKDLVTKYQGLVQSKSIQERLLEYYKQFTIKPIYITQSAQDSEHTSKRYNLAETKLPTFIKQSEKFLVIYGDLGSGKSTFMQQLLAQQSQVAHLPDPLYFYIKLGDDPCTSIITTLKNNGITDIEIKNDLLHRNSIFLLDGGEQLNSYKQCQLLLHEWPNAKFIVTCRKEKQDLIKSIFKDNRSNIIECYLSSFNKNDIYEFVTKYQRHFKIADNFSSILTEHSDIRQLIPNPLMLQMLLDILRLSDDFELNNLNRTKIYDRHKVLNRNYVLNDILITHGLPPGTNYHVACDNFAETLAVELFYNTGNYERFLRDDRDTSLIKKAVPISNHEGRPKFIHDSHEDYYLAHQFIKDLFKKKPDLWCHTLITKRTSLITFIAEMLNSIPETTRNAMVDELWEMVYSSRSHKKIAIITASNAATVLNYAGVSFSNRDLSGTILDDADLSNSCNYATNYSRASVARVDFRNALVKEANFNGTIFSNNTFGIIPRIKYTGRIKNIFLSPSKRYLAITFQQLGWIEICDLNNAHKPRLMDEVNSPVTMLAFSSDEQTLAFADESGFFYTWHFATGVYGHRKAQFISDIVSTEHNHFIVAADNLFFEIDNNHQIIQFYNEGVKNFWRLAGSDALLLASQKASLKIYDLKESNNNNENTLGLINPEVTAILYRDDETLFAHLYNTNQICLKRITPKTPKNALQRLLTDFLKQTSDLVLGSQRNSDLQHLTTQYEMSRNTLTDKTLELFANSQLSEETINQHHIRHYVFPNAIGKIIKIAFDPGGNFIYSASEDSSITVWDATKIKIITRLIFSKSITSLAVNNDGSLVAAANKAGEIYIWETETWQIFCKLKNKSSEIIRLLFTEDHLIAADKSDSVNFWITAELRSNHQVGHDNTIETIKISKDGAKIASLDRKGKLCFWQATSGQLLHSLQLQSGQFYTLSRYTKYAAFVQNKDVFIVDNNSRYTVKLNIPQLTILTLHFDPDEVFLFATCDNKDLIKIDIATLIFEIITLGNQQPIVTLEFLSISKAMIARCKLGKLYRYNFKDNTCSELSFLPEVNYVYTSDIANRMAVQVKNEVQVFDLTTYQLLFVCDYETPIDKLHISDDGNFLTVYSNYRIDVWDMVLENCLFHDHSINFKGFSWNHNQTNLLLLSEHNINSWHRYNFLPLTTPDNFNISYQQVFYANNYFFVTGNNGELEAWQCTQGQFSPQWILMWRSYSTQFDAENSSYTTLLPSIEKIFKDCGARSFSPYAAAHLLATRTDDDAMKQLEGLSKDQLEAAAGPHYLTPLQIGVIRNNFSFVEGLLKKNVRVDQISHANITALYHALYNGHTQIAQLLLRHQANLLYQCHSQRTPLGRAFYYMDIASITGLLLNITNRLFLNTPPYILTEAVYSDRAEIVRLLLILGANPYLIIDFGTQLHLATTRGNYHIVTEFIRYGIDLESRLDANNIEDPIFKDTMSKHKMNCCTALHLAVDGQHYNVVARLLKAGAKIYSKTKQGWLPLHFAALTGNLKITTLLLEYGAKHHINEKTEQDKSALSIAVEKGFDEVAIILIENGADPNTTEINIPVLFKCILENRLAVIAKLLAYGADIHRTFDFGYALTPLRCATELYNLDAVKLLLQAGANPNVQLRNGPTVIHYAISNGLTEILQELIKSEGNLHHEMNGLPNIILAAMNKQSAMVAFLLGKNVDPNAKDLDGNTALWHAVKNNDVDTVDLLAPLAANINHYYNNLTLLLFAATRNFTQVITILLRYKADPLLLTPNNVNIACYLLFYKSESTVIAILEQYPELMSIISLGRTLLEIAIDCKCYLVTDYIIDYYIAQGIRIKNIEGLISLAISTNNPAAISTLYRTGVNFNNLPQNPLFEAVFNAHYEAVKVLLDCGVDINARLEGATAVLFIITLNNQKFDKIFDLLLSRGADVNLTAKGFDALSSAVYHGNIPYIKKLLAHSPNCQVLDEEGNNLLLLACLSCDFDELNEIFSLLLPLGLSLEHKNKNGNTLYHILHANHIYDCKDIKLPSPPNLNTTNNIGISISELITLCNGLKSRAEAKYGKLEVKTCPMYLATILGDLEATRILFNSDAVTTVNVSGKSLVQIALEREQFAIATFYIQSGRFNLNYPDPKGETVVSWAAKTGNLELLKLAVQFGGSIAIKDKLACVIHYAVGSGNYAMIRYLHSIGADINAEDVNGNTPLEWASGRDYYGLEMMRLLIQLGANVNARNQAGKTILHLCVQYERFYSIFLLLLKGADPTLPDESGQTVIDLALELNLTTVVNAMLNRDTTRPILALNPMILLAAPRSNLEPANNKTSDHSPKPP